MKRTLLFAGLAILALSSSAQKFTRSLSQEIASQRKMVYNPTAAESSFTSSKTTAKMAPARIAHDGIYGLYISSSTDYTGTHPGCDSVWIAKDDITFQDGTKANTKIILCSESRPLTYYGNYDATTKKITVPALQYTGEYINAKSGIDYKTYIFSWVGGTEDDLLAGNLDNVQSSNDPITYTVNEDGSIDLDQLGLCFGIEDQESPWKNIFLQHFKPANAVISFTNSSKEYANAAYVDDFTYNVNVYGFAWFPGASGFDLSSVTSIDVNEDLSVTLHAGQEVWSCDILGVSDEEAGDYFMIYGTKPAEEEGYVTYDPDLTNGTVSGVLSGNAIQLYSFPIASKIWNDAATGEPKGYMLWYTGTTIVLDEGNYSAAGTQGIKDVNAQTREDIVKNTKTYNLCGQRVNYNSKGLVIRGGKKFFNK